MRGYGIPTFCLQLVLPRKGRRKLRKIKLQHMWRLAKHNNHIHMWKINVMRMHRISDLSCSHLPLKAPISCGNTY